MNISKQECEILSSLTLSSIKHNYPEFVQEFGYDGANRGMEKLFGNIWLKYRELVWQWYDVEYNKQFITGHVFVKIKLGVVSMKILTHVKNFHRK